MCSSLSNNKKNKCNTSGESFSSEVLQVLQILEMHLSGVNIVWRLVSNIGRDRALYELVVCAILGSHVWSDALLSLQRLRGKLVVSEQETLEGRVTQYRAH